MEQRPPLHLSVVAIEKEAFGSPSTKVTCFPMSYLLVEAYPFIWCQTVLCHFFSMSSNLTFEMIFSLENKKIIQRGTELAQSCVSPKTDLSRLHHLIIKVA